jgi:hypothetical protein
VQGDVVKHVELPKLLNDLNNVPLGLGGFTFDWASNLSIKSGKWETLL